MIEKLKYRMYGLVPYNISPIQQGIQFGHGVVEYLMNNFNKPETQYWAHDDKTFIILNGGTTNNFEESLGTLNKNLYLKGISQKDIHLILAIPYSSVRNIVQRLRKLKKII